MKPVKRVEIVIESVAAPQLLDILESHGFTQYTMMREASGKGDRGVSLGGVGGELNNSYILIACEPERAGELVEWMRPVLKRFGGMMLVSDALWVKH